jgi:DNA repair exonuclease SbcCD ATPase subunit
MLFNVCGDVTDADVIAGTPELSDLQTLLGRRSVAEFKKVVEAGRIAIKKERAEIPARIDEAIRSLPDGDTFDWQIALNEARTELLHLQNERANVASGGKGAEIRAAITDIESQMKEIETALRYAPNPAREAAIKSKRQRDEDIANARNAVGALVETVKTLNRMVSAREAELSEARAGVIAFRAKRYQSDDTCPSCNQPLPPDRVMEAVQAFNAAKAVTLDQMIVNGKVLVKEVDAMNANLATAEKELSGAESLLDIVLSMPEIVVPDDAPVAPEADERWLALKRDRDEKQSLLDDIKSTISESIKVLDDRIEVVTAKIRKAELAVANDLRRKSLLVRVNELRARETQLSEQHEEAERHIYLCELFTRTKVSMLTGRINSRFELTTFRLFREQINGGLQECCDILWRETGAEPSNGQSVQIGMDIIATLSEHAGFCPPIFIDNAESVTSFPKTIGQQIRLYVSDEPTLRVVADRPYEADPFQENLFDNAKVL